MKRLMASVLVFTILVLLVGCQGNQPSNAEAPNKSANVLKAWSGQFSQEELMSAIHEWKSNYTNIVLEKDGASNLSFETDFEVSSCSVIYLSPVDDTDISVELNGYIDLSVQTESKGKTVTVSIDWWDSEDDYLVWSYLIRVKDTDGGNHYYYFRVDYSARAQ